MSDRLKIPLFPLHTVLFPDGLLPLRVFEPRYTDMISACLRNDAPFGVCLIREGSEVGDAASIHQVGTLVKIEDWHTRHDGLLGITVLGQQRFTIAKEEVHGNQLLTAEVELQAPEPEMPVPAEFLCLVDVLREIIEQVAYRYQDRPVRYDDASWLGFRLAELLPIRLAQKQYFLQLNDPILRLERLVTVLERLELR